MRDNLRVRNSAEDYDRYTAGFIDFYDAAMIETLVEESEFRRRDGILIDVGTGTAQLLPKIAATPELAALDVIGTEYFDDMVDLARETVRKHELEDKIAIDKADVHAMPYPEDHAMYIISRSTVHHWANPVQAFKEIYRILHPQGIAVIHELRRDPNPEQLEKFNAARECAGVGPTTLEEKYTTDEIRDFLSAAGILEQCRISAPTKGPGSLGIEILIEKSGNDDQ